MFALLAAGKMFDDRQHTIIATFAPVIIDPYQDPVTGDWVIPDENPEPQTITQPGRAEVNSAAVKVPGKDGIKVDYSFMVYMDKEATQIPYDAQVTIKNEKAEVIGSGTVKRFARGTMDSRLWI